MYRRVAIAVYILYQICHIADIDGRIAVCVGPEERFRRRRAASEYVIYQVHGITGINYSVAVDISRNMTDGGKSALESKTAPIEKGTRDGVNRFLRVPPRFICLAEIWQVDADPEHFTIECGMIIHYQREGRFVFVIYQDGFEVDLGGIEGAGKAADVYISGNRFNGIINDV